MSDRHVIQIADDRIRDLILRNPLAYRVYTIAATNRLSTEQFLTELALALDKQKPPLSELAVFTERGMDMEFSEAEELADRFYARYVPKNRFPFPTQ